MHHRESEILEENVKIEYSFKTNAFADIADLGYSDSDFRLHTDKPHQNTEDVTLSKLLVPQFQTVPYKNLAPLCDNVTMQRTIQRLKLYNNEKVLATSRKRMNIKRKGLLQQWKDLERREEEMRKSFIHFDKFVKENNEKRMRAELKMQEDFKLIKRRGKELESLQRLMNSMIETTEKMESVNRRYKLHQAYLQEVVEVGKFNAINDVIDRYHDLVETKERLTHGQKSNMTIFETCTIDMMKLIEEKNFVIMGLNNQIANLQARYENANIKALESEELVTGIKNNAVKQQTEIDTVKNSIWNIYVHMTLSKKHPIKIKKDNVEEQMMYINRTLTELSKVNKLIKKKSTKKSALSM